MTRRALVMVAVIAAGGCKGTVHHDPPPAASDAVGGDAPAAPRPSAFSTEVAPPIPFDRFRPYMSHADVVAMIADAGLVSSRSSLPADLDVPDDGTIYATAIPDVFGYFTFGPDDRLQQITILGRHDTQLDPEITAHWGRGARVETPSTRGPRVFSAPASGWQIAFYDERSTVKLTFIVSNSQADAGLAKPNPKLWSDLGGLIGKPLEGARPIFGTALVKELDTRPTAERSDHRQGYARVATPWDDLPWQVTFSVDSSTEKISMVTATGRTDSEEARIALIASLKAAFGAPHTIVSDAGRIEIACSTDSLDVRLADSADEWTIAIRASVRVP